MFVTVCQIWPAATAVARCHHSTILYWRGLVGTRVYDLRYSMTQTISVPEGIAPHYCSITEHFGQAMGLWLI
jgi:hypothetical protein